MQDTSCRGGCGVGKEASLQAEVVLDYYGFLEEVLPEL